MRRILISAGIAVSKVQNAAAWLMREQAALRLSLPDRPTDCFSEAIALT